MSRAKRWCFTLNNYTTDEWSRLVAGGNADNVEYVIYAKETGESGTPHIQGFVIFKAAIRPGTGKTRLGSERYHLEVSRGTPQQAADYCKKDGDFYEFGDCPAVSQGKRTDLDRFYEWCDTFCGDNERPPSRREACREFPTIMCKYPRALGVAVERYEPPKLQSGTPREWQQSILDELEEPADDRTITFVVDKEGGKGKSWLVRYLIDREDVQFISIGKRDDLAHAVETHTQIFLFDVPRGSMEYLQYSVLEMLKNSLVFSPKYQSSMKRLLKTPHVIVFSNEHPDYDKMTSDRYYTVNI